ncbi:UDP-glucose 4-epimerase GalE, partial [Cytophagales bacterium LB-30]
FNAGYEPIIVDNFSNSERKAILGIEQIIGRYITLYTGDCADKEFMCEVLDRHHHIEGVIHFAAFKAVGESVQHPLKYYKNNVGALLTLLEVMEQYSIKNLVFSSSCTVYGQPDVLPVTEQSPRKAAESPYGHTKQMGEEMLEAVTHAKQAEIRAISLRYFNPIGAHPSALIGELPLGVPNNLVPFITQTAAGIREKLTVFGNDYNTPDGTCVRDYIHVVDLAKAHVKAIGRMLEGKGPSYEVFNIGTGNGNTVLEAIQAFEKVSGKALNYEIGPRRPGDVEKVYAEVSLSEKALGWKAELNLEDAMRDAWKWQQYIQHHE